MIISFNGHRSAVTTLVFDDLGIRLASGSKDTDIIVWDLVAETGLFKLRGHKDQITALQFLQPGGAQFRKEREGTEDDESLSADIGKSQRDHTGFLLSTSKDSLIKIWDVGSQHCIETHTAQTNGECWSMCISPDGLGCITAGNDGEMKAWSIDLKGLSEFTQQIKDGPGRAFLQERGVINRQGNDRTLNITFHPRGSYVAAHGSGKAIEIWRIRSDNEIQKALARKRKRRREKAAASVDQGAEINGNSIGENDNTKDISSAGISDIIVQFLTVRTAGKVRSIDWAGKSTSKGVQIVVASTNNQLALYNIMTYQREKTRVLKNPPDYNQTFAVEMPGHRTDIRSLALSSDDRMLASSCNGSLKIWNVRTQSCIRTLDCGYALCSSFLPGDKIVVVGNKNGDLELFDIASSSLIGTVKAHDGPVWTLHVHPDGRSLATGSADKTAKFFSFEVTEQESPDTRRKSPRFNLVHNRTLKVTDDILSLRFSPDSRLIALSLLDNTVKVFFVDSLKLFLNLYGHKLPVLSLDISFDSKLIITCSADKNIRIWGLDFGDCHKAFFAHQDSIMQVAFVPHDQDGAGHHFFSISKDHAIKYWDGAKFEQIQKLEGHHGEIWALAVSRTGEFIVTASHDKSLRTWQQTDEQIFLEEEREKELEQLHERALNTSLQQDENEDGTEHKPEAVRAGKQTTETLMAGEKIAEALELGIEDLTLIREWQEAKLSQPKLAPPDRHPIYLALGNISAEKHVLHTFHKVKSAALQDALLVLPFDKIPILFTFLQLWAERQWNIPLTCRILSFMLKTHHRQIIASKTMRPMLDGIRIDLRTALTRQKNEMGFNLAALRFVENMVKQKGTREYIDEAAWEDAEKAEKGKKRGFVDLA